MKDWKGIPVGNPTPLVVGGTGWRTRSTRETLRCVWSLRHHIGVTRLADLTELDRVGLPVASAVRPQVDSAQITAAQGKGLTGAQAFVSAMMEAAERWAASRRFSGEICASAQLEASGRRYADPRVLGGAASAGDLIEWIPATSLRDGGAVQVPASDVFFPYYTPAGCLRPSRPSTSGLASGNTLAEAILHGLFEVVERSVTSTAWQHDDAVRTIPSESLTGTERNVLHRLENAGARVRICGLENPLLPVYAVFTFDDDWPGPRILIGGQGAHLSARIALQRALAEAAQSRIVALQGSREDLVRHSTKWDDTGEQGREAFEQLGRLPQAPAGTVQPDWPEDPASIEDALALAAGRLASAGYGDIFYVDLTGDLRGMRVARVLVPGLVDRLAKG